MLLQYATQLQIFTVHFTDDTHTHTHTYPFIPANQNTGNQCCELLWTTALKSLICCEILSLSIAGEQKLKDERSNPSHPPLASLAPFLPKHISKANQIWKKMKRFPKDKPHNPEPHLPPSPSPYLCKKEKTTAGVVLHSFQPPMTSPQLALWGYHRQRWPYSWVAVGCVERQPSFWREHAPQPPPESLKIPPHRAGAITQGP